jgi:hypothetical protein
MQAHMWGLKTFYYSLINKAGSKQQAELTPEVHYNGFHDVRELIEDDADCEACKL